MALSWLQDYDDAELALKLESLLAYLKQHSPAVQRFLTMAEINFPAADGDGAAPAAQDAVPIFAATQLGPTVAATQVRCVCALAARCHKHWKHTVISRYWWLHAGARPTC